VVQFQCTLCGECCKWYWIPLTHLDTLRLKIYGNYNLKRILDLRSSEDNDEFTVEVEEERYHLALVKIEDACIFLDDGKCIVHDYKPFACRFYPFMYSVGYNGRITIEVNSEAVGKCPGLKIDSKIIPKEIRENLRKLARIRLLEKQLWINTIKSWNENDGRKRSLKELIEFIVKRAEADMNYLSKLGVWVK